MSIAEAVPLLVCPSCRAGLTLADRSVRCPAGHSFDLARQGYLNLLGQAQPANADSAEMLAARARVHDAGLFDVVAEAVGAGLARRSRILEVGSGTAYYLRRALGDDPEAVGIALDVSTAAGRAAARSDPRIGAVVADVWRPLPVRDHCLDAVLCVFSPRNLTEFARVLRPDGRLVVVTPKPEHLTDLRDRHGLLRIPEDKAENLAAAAAEFFEPVSTTGLLRTRETAPELAQDLVAMGPNAFHRVPEHVEGGMVTIAVTVQTFVPLSTPALPEEKMEQW